MIKTIRVFRLFSYFGMHGNCKLYERIASYGYVLQNCNNLFETYQFEEKARSGEQRSIFYVYPFREGDVSSDSGWTLVGRNRTSSVFKKNIMVNKSNRIAAVQMIEESPVDVDCPLRSEGQNSEKNRGAWNIAALPIMIYTFPYFYGKYFAGIINVWFYAIVIALSVAGLYLTELQLMRDRASLSGRAKPSSLDDANFRALFCFMVLSNVAQFIFIVVFPLMLLFAR